MELIIRDIKDIMADAADLEARASEYCRDIDRGINTNHHLEIQDIPKAQTIKDLMHYLVDAKDNVGILKDDIRDIREKLDTLLDAIDYERVREEAGL